MSSEILSGSIEVFKKYFKTSEKKTRFDPDN